METPLTSLPDDVARTRKVVAQIDGPAGYSYCGKVITESNDMPDIKALVYRRG